MEICIDSGDYVEQAGDASMFWYHFYCIIIKCDTEPCRFVSTGFTSKSLDYSVLKILYTNNSALTKFTQVRNHLQQLKEGVGSCKWHHLKSRQLTVNELSTDRGFDLKMETLPRISCIQVK
jgi:hypothetical protein